MATGLAMKDMVSIGIDTGGTFTDGFLVCGSQRLQAKVATTPHDLTECFVNILEALAAGMDTKLRDLLRRTSVIRYASTVGTNALIQRTGPKLGLITTAGSRIVEHFRGGADTQWLVSSELIREVDEQTSADGSVVRAVDREQVRRVAEEIVDQGARAIAISFGNSAFNAENERAARQVVRSEYPPYYLGSVPVLTAHDVSIRVGDIERTNAVLLSAYLRPDLVKYLYKTEEFLRDLGYNKPLLIAHSTGGVARIAKSTPLQTYNSGPVSGLLGSLEFATSLYDHDSVVTLDMGGTSLDIGLISKGKVSKSARSLVAGLPVNVPMVDLGIIGAGGGSIASADATSGELTVGPHSAGAVPGPAAYGLGGVEGTVTDANLVLGYLSADNFLGGRRSLHPQLSEQAFAPLAQRCGTDVPGVAWKVKCTVERNVVNAVAEQMRGRAMDPARATIYSYGGAAGIHVAAIARQLGCPRVYLFPFSSVFCAAGASTLDVVHLYEQALSGAAAGAGDEVAQANALAARHWEAAVRDMRGEGYGWESMQATLQLETVDARGAEGAQVELPVPATAAVLPDVAPQLRQALGKDQHIRVTRLVARQTVPSPAFPELPKAPGDAAAAQTQTRKVFWGKTFLDTPIYDSERLGVGHVVVGPAMLEGPFTSIAVPEGCRFVVDSYGIGLMEVDR